MPLEVGEVVFRVIVGLVGRGLAVVRRDAQAQRHGHVRGLAPPPQRVPVRIEVGVVRPHGFATPALRFPPSPGHGQVDDASAASRSQAAPNCFTGQRSMGDLEVRARER